LGNTVSIILAAGKGTRMKSQIPKVLHNICGQPMLCHVIRAAEKAGISRNIVVIGHGAETVRKAIDAGVEWVKQEEQLGTGHAVMQAGPLLSGVNGNVLVLCGDTPLITPDTLAGLIESHDRSGASVTVLTAVVDDPKGYGRILRNENGSVEGIVEHKDASSEQLNINEINTGIYCFNGQSLFSGLREISPANAQGEFYLTDVLAIIRKMGNSIGTVRIGDSLEVMGINDRVQLAEAERALRHRVLEELMVEGVTIIDPHNTYIDRDVSIGPDSIIYPGTIIEGRCQIGPNCRIGPYSRLSHVEVGHDSTIHNSVVAESVIGNSVTVGPFAYIRPGTVLRDDVKVGDFVEIKKSVIGQGSKVPHLSYVGDAEIGEQVNVGAGTITCNYDGSRKSKTVIGDKAFIGSNSNLVAPVNIGREAIVGAGSTVTKNVPEGALCVERSKQVVYPGWVARKTKKK